MVNTAGSARGRYIYIEKIYACDGDCTLYYTVHRHIANEGADKGVQSYADAHKHCLGVGGDGGFLTCEEFIEGDTERPYVHFFVACGDGVWVQQALAYQLCRG